MPHRSRTRTTAALLAWLSACAAPGADGDTDTEAAGSSGATSDAPTSGPLIDCGNDRIEGDEECDGVDLAGKQCGDLDPAYVGGALACGESCSFDASGCTVAPDQALVTLNELTSGQVLAGPYAGPRDAIELHNGGGAAADLSGWRLSDDPMFTAAKTYTFPPGTTLAPGAFLVLVARDAMTMVGDYPFGISDNSSETIALADAQGATVDSVAVDGYKAVVSYCRIPDSLGPWEQCEQTFDAANMLAATACGNGTREDPEACDGDDLAGQDCPGLGLGYSGGTLACTPKCHFDAAGCTTTSTLVINELEATADDIELHNAGAGPVDLSGWILTDDKIDADYDPQADVAALTFAPGTTIAAGEYRVIQAGTGPGQHPFGLGMTGDRVTLVRPDLTIVDQVTYAAGEADVSYCRQPDGPGGAWTADCVPTMGGPN